MPMIRIETRSKPPSGPSDQPPKQRRPVDGDGRGGRGTGPAIVAGALVGLVAIGLISVYVVTQRQAEPTVVPFGAPAAVATVAPAAAALAGVPALNGDFARTDIIAYVNGEPYTMGQLEVAVRVAKTLAAISKDPVPDFGAPEMRDFQIRLLRREIDSMLLRQALARTGTPVPPVDVQPVIDGYLKQYNGTPEQLAAALTAAGIGQRELLAWFEQGRDTQFYVQTQLMQGRQAEEREAVLTEWLAQQWATQDIQINFYDPSATSPAPGTAPTP